MVWRGAHHNLSGSALRRNHKFCRFANLSYDMWKLVDLGIRVGGRVRGDWGDDGGIDQALLILNHWIPHTTNLPKSIRGSMI